MSNDTLEMGDEKMDCIFCKIINKEIPSSIVYEDDEILAFKDIAPLAPVHIVVIPKKHIEKITQISEADEKLIGRIYTVINKIAVEQGIAEDGFRVIINCGENGGQEVKHIHFHLLGGAKLNSKIVTV